jgi:DNA-binding transcriptional LysR family regulator
MYGVHLRSVDLNLLVVLGALLETESVREAARRLALSPSATSHALRRLRDLFDDPLFVRAGRRLVPTPRAEALAPRVRALLEDAEGVLAADAPLDPSRLERAFTVATTDYAELEVLSRVGVRLAAEAPGVRLLSRAVPGVTAALRDRAVDLGIGVVREGLPEEFRQEVLFHEDFVVLLAEGHPALEEELDAPTYAALGHVLVAPLGIPRGVVDERLAERGLTRRVARTVGSFLVAPHLLTGTGYVLTCPRRVADRFGARLGLVSRPPPIPLKGFDIRLLWHRRHDGDAAHAWLRQRIRETPGGQEGGRRPG